MNGLPKQTKSHNWCCTHHSIEPWTCLPLLYIQQIHGQLDITVMRRLQEAVHRYSTLLDCNLKTATLLAKKLFQRKMPYLHGILILIFYFNLSHEQNAVNERGHNCEFNLHYPSFCID